MSQLIEVVDTYDDAARMMAICNACRYCEGFCAVFPAMTTRREFGAETLDYLSNLCHNCGACYHACQYKPPHEFDVNVPRRLAEVRNYSYQNYAWPRAFSRAFFRNGTLVSWVTAVSISLVLGLGALLVDSEQLWAQHIGSGAFYAIVPHRVMVSVAGAVFLFSIFASVIGCRRFLRHSGPPVENLVSAATLKSVAGDIASMRYLGGGHGEGCNDADERFSNKRRYYHQLTMWGFLLCFAATSVASVYELALGWMSPFDYTSLPVLLGTVGGAGLIVGPLGLIWVKRQTAAETRAADLQGADYGLLVQLLMISITGFAVLIWRESSAMGLLLLLHLGWVLGFFLLLPYGKFVHGVYRFAALLRFHAEKRVG
jgi:citrate/tricarballylate utilization protein